MRVFYTQGLQRSGTNYLQTLVEKNFKDVRLNRDFPSEFWKHAIDMPESQYICPTTFLFVVHKNPYTWIESLFKIDIGWKQKQTTYDASVGPEEHMIDGWNIVSLAKTYKHFHNTWIWKLDKRFHHRSLDVRYEDLLVTDDRNMILSEIQKRFGPEKRGRWINPSIVPMSGSFTNKMQDYYLKGIPEKLSDFHIDLINETIGEDKIRSLGYEVL